MKYTILFNTFFALALIFVKAAPLTISNVEVQEIVGRYNVKLGDTYVQIHPDNLMSAKIANVERHIQYEGDVKNRFKALTVAMEAVKYAIKQGKVESQSAEWLEIEWNDSPKISEKIKRKITGFPVLITVRLKARKDDNVADDKVLKVFGSSNLEKAYIELHVDGHVKVLLLKGKE